MIIDAHVHWWKKGFLMVDPYWPVFMSNIKNGYYKPFGFDFSDEEMEKIFLDPDGSSLLQRMNEAGIDKTVLLPLDWGKYYGQEPTCDIIATNREYANLAKTHPDRLIAFFTIDPRRGQASDHFLTAVKEWGMKGLKLYPPTGFLPGDDCCIPFYKICMDMDLPVTFHCTDSPMSKEDQCHPDNFVPVLKRFPELRLNLAHAGGDNWFEAAIKLVGEYKNVYADISGWQIYNKQFINDRLQYIIKQLGSLEKVMFGSDYPIFYGIHSLPNWVAFIQALDIPQNEKENLMGKSAARFLGL